jgi:hypothetical protein
MKWLCLLVYHYSSKLNVWAWRKLYINREEGLGYGVKSINKKTNRNTK